MRSIEHLPADAATADVGAALDRDGVVIVDDRFRCCVGELRIDLARHLARTTPGSRSDDPEWQVFHGARTKRLGGVAGRSARFVDVLLDDVVLCVARDRLAPASGDQIQCAGTQVMAVGPGEDLQYLHRDQSTWDYFNHCPGAPEVAVSAMIALTDFTERNGATRVVVGSHVEPDSPELFDQELTVAAEMDAGSVLMFSGRTVHGAGANRTTADRIGLHLLYALGWLRAEEAHYTALTEQEVRRLPPAARRLLGFGAYDPAPLAGARLATVDFEDPAPRYAESPGVRSGRS